MAVADREGTPFEQALRRLEAERDASPHPGHPIPVSPPRVPPSEPQGRLVHVPVRVRVSIDEAAWLKRHGGTVDDLVDAVRRYVPEALRESSAARAGLIVSARRVMNLRSPTAIERPGVPTGALSSRPPYAFEATSWRRCALSSSVAAPSRSKRARARSPLASEGESIVWNSSAASSWRRAARS